MQQADELKSEFIRNITHELKTPVTILSGFAELLLYDEHENLLAEQVEMLTTIDTHAKHLTRLVNDVVVLRRVQTQAGERASIAICDLAQQSLAEIRHRMTKAQDDHYRFALDCPDPTLTVLGDGEQLTRVFANLLDNALKFSPDGGEIAIAVQSLHAPLGTDTSNGAGFSSESAAGSGQRSDVWVEVAISDEGIGIPPDKRDAVWERLVQLDGSTTRRFGGTGLGLALVREVVEAHGGYAWLDSAADAGTTVYFALPFYDGQLQPPGLESPPVSVQAVRATSALLADSPQRVALFHAT